MVLVLLNSLGAIRPGFTESLGQVSRVCLVVAISALGIKTSFEDLVKLDEPTFRQGLADPFLRLGIAGQNRAIAVCDCKGGPRRQVGTSGETVKPGDVQPGEEHAPQFSYIVQQRIPDAQVGFAADPADLVGADGEVPGLHSPLKPGAV